MTTLRDDGYLETDDTIVAACFLDKTVWFCGECDITTDVLIWISTDRFIGTVCVTDRICVDAATVAEVWGDQPSLRLRHGVILAALDETSHDSDIHETVLNWMDEHAKEVKDEN